jgi:hypothetical protein
MPDAGGRGIIFFKNNFRGNLSGICTDFIAIRLNQRADSLLI